MQWQAVLRPGLSKFKILAENEKNIELLSEIRDLLKKNKR